MKHILMVAEVRSYLLISIRERLKEAAYDVTEIAADIDAINEISGHLDGILIYLDESLYEKQQALFYLKDRAITNDSSIFIAGESKYFDLIKGVFPKSIVRQEFRRPLNVIQLVATIDSMIQQATQLDKKKILAVDDSGAMLRTVKEWLEEKYSVSLANSATMAIKYMTLNRPDLILLDYDMPVCDGRQVLEMIRSETDFSDIPVMFLTHKEDMMSVAKAKLLNPEAYLLKSMTPEQIIQAVDDYFEMKKGIAL